MGRRGGESGEGTRNCGGWAGGTDATAFSAATEFSAKFGRAIEHSRGKSLSLTHPAPTACASLSHALRSMCCKFYLLTLYLSIL